MKKIVSLLSAVTLLSLPIQAAPLSVRAMEAATYQEHTAQMKETAEFPDPDMKYISLIDNNLEFRLYDEFAVLSECKDRNVTEVEIPSEIEGVPVVGSVGTPFGRCRELKKIVIPDTFEHFEWYDLICTTVISISSSFTGSSQSVTIASDNDELIPSVSEVVISETNPYYTSVDGIVYTKDMKTLIGCPPAKDIKEIQISEQTETIGDYAFVSCFKLEKAVIPDNIKHINNGAFAACINLRAVEFPESIKVISGDVCFGCESLSDVVLNGKIEKIGYGAFGECPALETFAIPDTVTYIGFNAFENCKCINDTDGVYYVGNWVVGSSDNVENADIKEGTVGIAEASFFTRNQMKHISVPSSVRYIGYLPFGQISSSESTARMDYRCSFIDDNTLSAAKATSDFYIYDAGCDISDSEKAIPATYKYTEYVETDNDFGTLIDGKFYDKVKVEEDTVIHGYADSTAQAYAEKYDRRFALIEDSAVKGDVNADGLFSVSDAVVFQKWLLGTPDAELSSWETADLCKDGKLDFFDLCMMKKLLTEQTAK